MNRERKSCADYTEYPKLFNQVYWGRGDTSARPNEDILNNRNKFAESHRGIKVITKIPQYIRAVLNFAKLKAPYVDHEEWYKDLDFYIMLISIPDCYDVESEIWEKIDRLYSTGQFTYMIKIPIKIHDYHIRKDNIRKPSKSAGGYY